MGKVKTVTSFQLFSMIFISIIFYAMMYSSYFVREPDLLMMSTAAFLSFAVLLTMSVPLFLFAEHSSKNNIIQYVQSKKPILSGTFSFIYIIYFVYAAVVSLISFSLLLSNFINPGLSFAIFFILAIICCYYAAYKGITGIGRASTVFFILISISIVIVCVSLFSRIRILNYSYVFSEDFNGLWENTFYLSGQASAIPAIFLFVHKIKNNVKKTVITSIAVSMSVVFVLSLIAFGVLGEYFYKTPYPFYTSTQLIEVGAFQRLDVIFLAHWTVGMFVNVSISLAALRETVQSSFSAKKAKILNPTFAFIIVIFAFVSIKNSNIINIITDVRLIIIMFLSAGFIFPLTAVLIMGKKKLSGTTAKTVAVSVAVLMIFPLFSGCQKTQIQDRLIIKGIGIDKVGEEYAVTVQYVDNYSDGDKQSNKCLQVKGKSIGEAVGNIKNSSGNEPFLGQNSAMIIGWDTARKDIDTMLDYFIRYSDARPTVKLYLSKTTAEDILTLSVSGELIPIDHMTAISPSNSETDNLYTILDFINLSQSSTDTPTLPVLEVDQNTVKLLGAAAVSNYSDELFLLNEEDYIAYKTLIGIDDGTVLSFDGVSGKVTDCKTNIYANETSGTLNFNAVSELAVTILENPDNVSNSEIERLFGKKLTEQANRSAEKMLREKGMDIYRFGRHLMFEDSKKYSQRDLYTNNLYKCKVNIRINCKTVETTR